MVGWRHCEEGRASLWWVGLAAGRDPFGRPDVVGLLAVWWLVRWPLMAWREAGLGTQRRGGIEPQGRGEKGRFRVREFCVGGRIRRGGREGGEFGSRVPTRRGRQGESYGKQTPAGKKIRIF